MARIWVEGFEGAGYENAWTGGTSVGVGATLDPDEPASGAGSPPGWGSQCLLVDAPGSVDCYVYHVFADQALAFCALDARVSAKSLAEGQVCLVSAFYALDATQRIGSLEAARLGGVDLIRAVVFHDGSVNVVWSEALELNRRYVVEFKWDSGSDAWAFWLNGSPMASGVLTGAAAGWAFDTLLLGTAAAATGAMTYRVDRVAVDDASQIHPAPPPMFRGS